MGIFDKRKNYKPFEYPEVNQFIDVINSTYWKVKEVDFTGDIQDFKTRLSYKEQEVIRRSLLAIAQVEVDVKTFWGDLYKSFPKPEFNNMGATFAENECYDKETQVLTNNGFKYFKDLTTTDKVAQYNMETFEVDFVKPLDYIIKPFKGKMHHYNSTQTDLMVTPNHDILVKLNNNKSPWSRWRKVKSNQGIWGKNFSMPTSGYKKTGKSFTFLDRLLIAIQADGSLMGTCPSNKNKQNFYFTFLLKKERKIQRLKWILDELNLPYIERLKPTGQLKINGSLKGRVDFNIIEKIKNFSYINLEEIDAEWGEQFIEELSQWDCYKPKQENRNHITYYNTNVSAIDKIVEICSISGFRTCKHISKPVDYRPNHMVPGGYIPKTKKALYSLNITKTNKTTYPYVKEVDYDGMVYCVTVPWGNIITRRNKHVAVSGNCTHSEAYSKLLEVLNYEDDFIKLLEIPVFKEKLKLIEESMSSKTDIVEKLLFFTIVIENSSLFSQFANILSFSKFKGIMKNVANIILWTQNDELIHCNSGIYMLNLIQKEYPERLDQFINSGSFKNSILKYIEYESHLIDWIFEEGELDWYTKEDLLNFMKFRVDDALSKMDCWKFGSLFNITPEELKPMKWWDIETKSQSLTDFFSQRPVDYSKHNQSFSEDNLF